MSGITKSRHVLQVNPQTLYNNCRLIVRRVTDPVPKVEQVLKARIFRWKHKIGVGTTKILILTPGPTQQVTGDAWRNRGYFSKSGQAGSTLRETTRTVQHERGGGKRQKGRSDRSTPSHRNSRIGRDVITVRSVFRFTRGAGTTMGNCVI